MPGVIEELEILISKAGLNKTVADAKLAGDEIAKALVDTPAVKREMQDLANALSSEVGKASGRIKMDMAALGTASSQIVVTAVHPMTAAMSQAAAQTATVGAAATRATPGINTMRGALVQMAAQATGMRGPLGSLANGLLTFSGGGLLALGVAAGLGILAKGWELIAKKSREAAAALRDFVKAAEAANLAAAPAIDQINAQINSTMAKIDQARTHFEERFRRFQAAGRPEGYLDAALKQDLKDLQTLRIQLDRLLAERRQLTAGTVDPGSLSPGAGHGRSASTPVGRAVADATDEIIAVGELNEQIIAQGADAAAEAIKTGAELTKDVITDLDEQYKAQNTTRLAETGAQAEAVMTTQADINSMLAEWDAEDRARKKAGHIAYLAHLEEQAYRLERIIDNTMGIASAWGLVSDAMAESLSSLGRLATDSASFAKSLATGDVLGAIGAGINIIGDIGGVLGIKGSKDPERLETNRRLHAAAMQGDEGALEKLLDRSGRGGSSGLATRKAKDDAWAKYQSAKAAQAAANAPALEAQAAEEAERAKDEAERQRLEDIRAGEEKTVAEREQADELASEEALRKRAEPLGDAIVAQVQAAIAESRAADKIAEQSELGEDSPLARDARRRANEKIREAEKAVEEADRARSEAGGFTAGFQVTRTLTESSAGRVIGELVTSNLWLERIYQQLGGTTGARGGAVNVVIDQPILLDGEEIARNTSQYQYEHFQQLASQAGHIGMPG